MSELGSIGWIDLTVDGTDELRDFYEAVVGWKVDPVSMGDYSDYNMCAPESGEPKTGICHARGENKGVPPVWMIYIVVEDLDLALDKCKTLGGKLLRGPTGNPKEGRTVVISDPAGTVCSLYQPAKG